MHYNRSVLLYQLYLQSFTLRVFLYYEALTLRGSDSQHRKASQSFQNHRQQL